MKKIVLFTLFLVFSSCATIFTGTKDTIRFESEPSGARVFIDSIEECTTPCEVEVPRKVFETRVMLKHEGYKPKTFPLRKAFNAVSVLNLGNLLFWAIDVVSGAVMKYDKKEYKVTLKKEGEK